MWWGVEWGSSLAPNIAVGPRRTTTIVADMLVSCAQNVPKMLSPDSFREYICNSCKKKFFITWLDVDYSWRCCVHDFLQRRTALVSKP